MWSIRQEVNNGMGSYKYSIITIKLLYSNKLDSRVKALDKSSPMLS